MVNAALAGFIEAHPEYADTASIDELRASEYGRLDAGGHVYLDYTGASLYAASQVAQHAHVLAAHVFGNPHSASPASSETTALVERCRRAVLAWFHAPPSEYTAVFTKNATGALKLVGEAYPFRPGSRFVLTVDNHNSVNGIREFAAAAGARVDYEPLTTPDLRSTTLSRRPRSFSHSRRNRISPASSTRSNSSRTRARTAGTSCSTRRRSPRRTTSICRS